MRLAAAVAALAAALCATGASAEPPRKQLATVTSATCADDAFARMVWNELVSGWVKPYAPFRGPDVVARFRRAGFDVERENRLFFLYESGLRFPEICDFRWFGMTVFGSETARRDGLVKIFVTSTPATARFEERERRRLARKYGYERRMTVLRRGNVVVEYWFELESASGTYLSARRNRLADVRRVLSLL